MNNEQKNEQDETIENKVFVENPTTENKTHLKKIKIYKSSDWILCYPLVSFIICCIQCAQTTGNY